MVAYAAVRARPVPARWPQSRRCRHWRSGRGRPRHFSRTPASARIDTREHPEYIYDLVHHYADEVPDGGVVDATGDAVAAVVEDYRGLGTTSQDGLLAMEELIGWVPSRGGVANLGQMRLVPFPSAVTHYVSADAVWERKVMVLDATYLGECASLYAPRRGASGGGSTTRDTWFGGPVGSRVSPCCERDERRSAAGPRQQAGCSARGAPSPMRPATTANSDLFDATSTPAPSSIDRDDGLHAPTGPRSSTKPASRPVTTTSSSGLSHVHSARTRSGSCRLTSGPVRRVRRGARSCCPCPAPLRRPRPPPT